ncbi:hypothetical protein, partial [Streptomyces sp. NPDC007070]|uniref:hypothetical protein n=1 Tax=Streptomyces sp. NPDC007070 TaxID=3154312 RepID=UPI0033D4317F
AAAPGPRSSPRRGRRRPSDRASSAAVAVAVARAAAEDGVATRVPDNLVQAVQDAMWQPAYDGPAGGEG